MLSKMIEQETPTADAEERNEAWSRYQERRERFSVAGALLGAAVGVSLVLAATPEMDTWPRLILTIGLGGVSALIGAGFANDPIGKWLVEKNYSFSLNFLSRLRSNTSKGISDMNRKF